MYRQVKHTADVGLNIHSENFESLFVEAAHGFQEILFTKLKTGKRQKRQISLSADTFEELLVGFISELNFIFETDNVCVEKVEKLSLTENQREIKLSAEITVGEIDWERSIFNTEVKAVTYHQLKIKGDKNSGYNCTVYFDL